MNISITIPDENSNEVLNNIALATGYDKSTKEVNKRQWVSEVLAKQARAFNIQGAMIKAKASQEATNTLITG